ncbi:MAG: transcription antitermination factor NusB [Candidatus Eisenbacteria bacterium]
MSGPRIPDDFARGGRTRAREVVFRAAFEADLTGDDPLEVLELSLGRFRFTPDGRAFALRLARGLSDRLEEVDALLTQLLERWSLARVSTVVRAILRVGSVELLAVDETAPAVVVNEAVRLAKRYGEEDSAAFVNGVLDAAARRLRPGAFDRDEGEGRLAPRRERSRRPRPQEGGSEGGPRRGAGGRPGGGAGSSGGGQRSGGDAPPRGQGGGGGGR